MKLRLSTLLSIVALAAIVLAWGIERRNTRLEFEDKLASLVRGSEVVASARLATGFLWEIEDRIIMLDSPDDERKRCSRKIAVRELVKLWRYRDDVQYYLESVDPQWRYSDWSARQASELWDVSGLADSDDFFCLARSTELRGQDENLDEFKSLRKMIEGLAR